MSEAYDLTAVITTHNEGLVAHKTMRSVLSAIEEVKKAGYSYEIIVHIDNGDEETKKYFKRYEGRKDIRIIENKFGDAGPSRNFAATKARGKYVAFLDGDDLISANWYVKALAILKEHDDAIVYPEAILTFGMDEAVNRLTIQKDSMDIASESIVMVG